MSTNGVVKQQTFRKLGLDSRLVNALASEGIETTFPIQASTIPDALAGHDILGRGQTGSGKTLAFGLSVLHNIRTFNSKPGRPVALILAPTRELAQQINEVISKLAKTINHKSILVAGGLPITKQIAALKKPNSIVIATPGRLLDLVKRNHLSLDDVQIVVLDEADQMSDMGFLPDVRRILNLVKLKGQRLLFSATLDKEVDVIVQQYLSNPVTHQVADSLDTSARSAHYLFVINHEDKVSISSQIASRDGKAIFFTRTKRGADRLSANLANLGVHVGTLHGGKSQSVRTRTLADFKTKESGVLVATDVAARGIHVDDVDLVVHFDAAADHKDYLHRSGRTARAGKVGRVITLISKKEQKSVGVITQRAGVDPKVIRVVPMDQELVKITGAKKPSGKPIRVPVTEVEKTTKSTHRKNPKPSSHSRSRARSRKREFAKSGRKRSS